jgi:hypothetical protein
MLGCVGASRAWLALLALPLRQGGLLRRLLLRRLLLCRLLLRRLLLCRLLLRRLLLCRLLLRRLLLHRKRRCRCWLLMLVLLQLGGPQLVRLPALERGADDARGGVAPALWQHNVQRRAYSCEVGRIPAHGQPLMATRDRHGLFRVQVDCSGQGPQQLCTG